MNKEQRSWYITKGCKSRTGNQCQLFLPSTAGSNAGSIRRVLGGRSHDRKRQTSQSTHPHGGMKNTDVHHFLSRSSPSKATLDCCRGNDPGCSTAHYDECPNQKADVRTLPFWVLTSFLYLSFNGAKLGAVSSYGWLLRQGANFPLYFPSLRALLWRFWTFLGRHLGCFFIMSVVMDPVWQGSLFRFKESSRQKMK
jgi:hypothetical protein